MTGRIHSYMPIQKFFSLADRVRIANTYFTPVLSYIFRFFLMSEVTWNEVLASLKKLLGQQWQLYCVVMPRSSRLET